MIEAETIKNDSIPNDKQLEDFLFKIGGAKETMSEKEYLVGMIMAKLVRDLWLNSKESDDQTQYDIKAVRDTIELASKAKRHIELLNTGDEQYIENENSLSYEAGRKLFLEVNVTNREMSRFLLEWLYSKDRPEYLGCRLEGIHFGNPKDAFKEELLKFIEANK